MEHASRRRGRRFIDGFDIGRVPKPKCLPAARDSRQSGEFKHYASKSREGREIQSLPPPEGTDASA
jgi:hypothetical protein